MTKIAVLDDWQGIARDCADWSALEARAEVTFFREAFSNEDVAAQSLAPFEIILSMRERTAFPASLVQRLPNLKMFSLTGARAGSIDSALMMERGVTVCVTKAGGSGYSTSELAPRSMVHWWRRVGAAGSATSNSETWVPCTRPSRSASWPTPSSRSSPRGWR